MLKILLTCAPTGAGKTYACVQHIVKMIRDGDTVILAQPTKILNDQTRSALLQADDQVNIHVFNGDTVSDSPSSRLADHLRRPPDYPHVILTTIESFERLPFRSNCENYHLIFDEVPAAFKVETVSLPYNHTILTDLLITTPVNSTYDLLSIKHKDKLRTIAENRLNDAVYNVIRSITYKILDTSFEAYVHSSTYEKLKRGSNGDVNLTVFFLRRVTSLDGFKSVRIIGARAHETILYKLFSDRGVCFVEDEEIARSLRYVQHENGPLIDFHYASERNWSIVAQDNDPYFRSRFIEAASQIMKGAAFGWIDNKKWEKNHPLHRVAGGKAIPHNAHGLNEFQCIDNAIILTAFNYDNASMAFLRDVVGMVREQQKIALDYHNTYQTLSRLSIRDPDNSNRKIVVLPDRLNAEWQSKVFPGSSIRSLGIDDRQQAKKGRPKKYNDASERKRANRSKLHEEQRLLIEKHELGNQRMSEAGYQYLCHENTYNLLVNNVTEYQGSLVRNKFEGASYPLLMSSNDFVRYLRELHKRTIADKNDNSLIMSALCIPTEETQRATTNAIWGRHIYLDIDDTDLKPKTLSQLFPKQNIIAYNSFSNAEQHLRIGRSF